jgi:hypothetical protein
MGNVAMNLAMSNRRRFMLKESDGCNLRELVRIAGFFSRLLLFDVNAKHKIILGVKERSLMACCGSG